MLHRGSNTGKLLVAVERKISCNPFAPWQRCIFKRHGHLRCILHRKRERIKEVSNVKYLGFITTAEGRSDTEGKKKNSHGKGFTYQIGFSL